MGFCLACEVYVGQSNYWQLIRIWYFFLLIFTVLTFLIFIILATLLM